MALIIGMLPARECARLKTENPDDIIYPLPPAFEAGVVSLYGEPEEDEELLCWISDKGVDEILAADIHGDITPIPYLYSAQQG